MKKLSFIMTICLASNLLVAAEEFRTSPNKIIVANYTNKPMAGYNISQSVITNIIAQLQGRPATLVFDHQTGWTVDNVSFSNNISIEILPGAYFVLSNPAQTCTFNTNYIIAPPNEWIFRDNGGTFTGALANAYIPAAWGGGSALGHGAIYGELPVWMTNIYRRLDTNYTDDITTTNIAAYVPKGYIKDAWASYASTNQVYINEGEGYCNGKYFLITNKITVSVGNLTFGTNFHYIYIDDSASTYPSSLVLVESANAPTFNASRSGWYNGDDRILSCVINTNTVIEPFINNDGVYFRGVFAELTERIHYGTVSSTTNWVVPNIVESSNLLPLNASHAVVWARSTGDGVTALAYWYVTTKEMADIVSGRGTAGTIISGMIRSSDPDIVANGDKYIIPIGESRNLRVGSAITNCIMDIRVNGWRIHR